MSPDAFIANVKDTFFTNTCKRISIFNLLYGYDSCTETLPELKDAEDSKTNLCFM